MHQYIALEDTVYLGFASNLTSGAAGDGASPLYDVRLGGAAAGAAPVLSGTPTLLTSGSYSDGCYEVAIAATAANGFAAGNTYLVFVTLTIDSVTPAAMIGSFRIAPVPANLTQMGGVAQSATDLKDFADDGYDPATNKVQGVVLVDTLTTYTGNTVQTGDAFARLGAPAGASVSADIAVIESQTDDIGVAGAGLTAIDLPDQTMNITGNITGSVGSVVGAVGSVTGAVGSVTAAVTVGTINANVVNASALAADAVTEIQAGLSTLTEANIRTAVGLAAANLDTQLDTLPTAAEIVAAQLTTAITEAYRANGAAPTLAQFMSEVLGHIGEAAIVGTVKTINKFDHVTPAATFTLDSATAPTSVTRAS